MDIKEVRDFVRQVEGFLRDREGELLYALAKNCKGKGVIVEIGAWKGKSTIWLASGSKAGNSVKIYSVDPHTGSSEHREDGRKIQTFEEFKKNVEDAKVNDIVVPLVKTSEEAARDFNEPVEFVFIDGAHEYEYVKLDFDLWFPKLINRGVIAFHDTTGWPGPKKVAVDCVYKSIYFRHCGWVDSITFAEKIRRNSIKDRIRNRYILFLRNVYELAASLHLPKQIRMLGNKIILRMQQ